MKTLLDEYSALLENAIERMKKEYPDFIVYTMTITTEEDNNLSYISFDSKQKSLNRLQEWENEYSYRIEAIYYRAYLADNEQSLNFTFDKGIIAGFPDKTFRGNSTITREQIAAVLYGYAKYKGYSKGYSSDTNVDISKYKDFKDVADWAKESVKWAIKYNIITGRTADSISPKAELTRAELAQILKNFHIEFIK